MGLSELSSRPRFELNLGDHHEASISEKSLGEEGGKKGGSEMMCRALGFCTDCILMNMALSVENILFLWAGYRRPLCYRSLPKEA